MLELMQYADGEADAETRARVEGLLRTSGEARGVVEAMGALGDVVRQGLTEREGPGGARATGSPMASWRRSTRAARVPQAWVGGARTRRRRMWCRLPMRRVRSDARGLERRPAVFVVLALAAGVMLFVRSQGTTTEGRYSGGRSGEDSETPTDEGGREALAQTETPGIDLEEVRSTENRVDVFFSLSEVCGTSVVVWIDDRPGGH